MRKNSSGEKHNTQPPAGRRHGLAQAAVQADGAAVSGKIQAHGIVNLIAVARRDAFADGVHRAAINRFVRVRIQAADAGGFGRFVLRQPCAGIVQIFAPAKP